MTVLASGTLNRVGCVVWHALIKIIVIDNTKSFVAILCTQLNFTARLEVDLNHGFISKV